jgi:hypothetical protein
MGQGENFVKARDVLGTVYARYRLLLALGVLAVLALPSSALADTTPSVSGEEASEVGVTTAKLSGQVNPNGATGDGNTTWRLQWSPAGTDHGPEGEENWNFGNEGTIEAPASEEANPVGVEAMVGFGGELQPGQEYELRLQAENGGGQAETAAPYPTFTMDAATSPVLAAEPASGVSIASAHLSGTVDPEGGNLNPIGPEAMPIHWELQYSTDGSSWSTAGSGDITGAEAEGTTPIAVAADATGLVAATEYQVRLHAYTNSPTFALFVEADSPGPNPTFETDPALAPALTIDPAEDVTSDGAHLSGTIDPEGGNEDALAGVLPIQWELQINREGEGWSTVGSGELTGSQAESEEPIEVEADPSGLVPNSTYKARLLARYAGREALSGEGEFETLALGPTIRRETLFNPTATSIQLRAQVNPHNSVLTECHFEYGAGGSLDQTAPCGSLPGGNDFTAVAAVVSDLTPGTEYEFRLVATSAAGTSEGEVRSFTSLEEPGPEACPNAAIRKQQHATHLPDCRAWEMVTPLEKGNGDIVADGFTNIASTDGDAITFNTRTPFGDTIGSGVSGQTTYIARRGPSGWESHGITPTGNPEVPQTLLGPTRIFLFSDDLRNAVVQAYDLPAVPDDAPLRANLYLEDTATRELDLVTASQVDRHPFFEFLESTLWPTSADARHLAFATRTKFLPDAAAGVKNIYQWDDGVLSLAGILPNGEVPAEGSNPPLENSSSGAGGYRQSMSADGSRLLFMASDGGNQQLYQRIDGGRTVWISQTELDPSDPDYQPDPSGVTLRAATPDGRNVFFMTDTPLVEDDTNGFSDIYRYTDSPSPSTDTNLTLIGVGGDQVVGTSDDGQRVYMHNESNAQLSVWDHGIIRVIGNGAFNGTASGNRLGVTDSVPGLGRVTPDGRYMAFVSGSTEHTVDLLGNITNENLEAYVYTLDNDSLVCASCPAEGARTGATVNIPVTDGNPVIANIGIRPQFLSDHGQVFFTTPEGLVPGDTNGTTDAYSFDPATGRPSLLSSGKGSGHTTFADASASGDDLFIATRSPLLGRDSDDLVDLYDVSVEGGLPEPGAPPGELCSGESCQGNTSAAPPVQGLGSAVGSRGNPPTRRCPKGKKRVRRHGKVRCVSKKKDKTRTHRVRAGRGGGR